MPVKPSDTLDGVLEQKQEQDHIRAVLSAGPVFVERFPEVLALSTEEENPVIYAVGRFANDVIVVTCYSNGDVYGPTEFRSFITHAPFLAHEVLSHPNAIKVFGDLFTDFSFDSASYRL